MDEKLQIDRKPMDLVPVQTQLTVNGFKLGDPAIDDELELSSVWFLESI
jgi:hypothetical protein